MKTPKKSKILDWATILTPTQIQTLELVCKGLNAKEISDELCVSTRTIEGHLLRIKKRLGAKSLPHAVAIYVSKLKEK